MVLFDDIKVNGCTGKMGRAVLEASISAGLQPVSVCFSGPGDAGKIVEVSGKEITVHGPSDRENILSSVFEEHPNLIVVDYTVPAAVNGKTKIQKVTFEYLLAVLICYTCIDLL